MKYRGFTIEALATREGYEPRVSVSRPVPFLFYRTLTGNTADAKRLIDETLDGKPSRVVKLPGARFVI